MPHVPHCFCFTLCVAGEPPPVATAGIASPTLPLRGTLIFLQAGLAHAELFRQLVTSVGFGHDGGVLNVHSVNAFNRHQPRDRKSTRLNSSHGYISYAVFCLKKKKLVTTHTP